MTISPYSYLLVSVTVISLIVAWGLALFIAYCLVAINPRDDEP